MRNLPYQNHQNQYQEDVRRIKDPALLMQPVQRISSSLLIVTLIMISFGLVMLFSASMSDGYASQSGNSMYYVLRQSGITAFGLVVALFIALVIPIRFFDHIFWSAALFLLTTGLLVYVRIAGVVINNARRWVSLGIMFQPSELAKISIIFCFAGYVAWIRRLRRRGRLHFRSGILQFFLDGWIDILLPGAGMLIWIGLVAWQPHVSGAVILGFIGLVILLLAGYSFRSWTSAAAQILLLFALVIMLFNWLMPLLPVGELQQSIEQNFAHVTRRLEIYSNPDEAGEDSTYQVDQSIIAIGSGGPSGLGLGEGRQKYNYLPEAHNDFVFAIIGEELGFVGSVAVLLLFMIFMIIGLAITFHSQQVFTAVLAGGYTMLITVQALLNIGVATRVLPPTGISLPFFSYGGTPNLFFLLAIGFILASSRTGRRTLYPAAARERRQMQPASAQRPEPITARRIELDKERIAR